MNQLNVNTFKTVRFKRILKDAVRKRMRIERSNEEERRVDALALRADERRDKLRKASGRSKYPLIRRSLNGETHHIVVSIRQYITYGGEPPELKHLSRERKSKKHRFPK